MKKKLLFTIMALSITVLSYSQETAFGVKGGLNFANITGDVDGSSITSFHIGGKYNMMMSDQFGIQPEFVISGQGSEYTVGLGPFGSVTAKVNVLYANIPVMAKYYVTEMINLHAGPQIGVLISDDGTGWNTLDLGLGLGGSLELDGGFTAGLRYNLGLTDVADGGSAKNSVIQISAGFFFL